MNPNHTPGPWSISHLGGAVVSAEPIPDMTKKTGHGDTGYYGGYLICESVLRREDAQLIAAAPDLLAITRRAHRTIDRLLAMLIQRDPDFLPSQDAMFALYTARDALNVIEQATGFKS